MFACLSMVLTAADVCAIVHPGASRANTRAGDARGPWGNSGITFDVTQTAPTRRSARRPTHPRIPAG